MERERETCVSEDDKEENGKTGLNRGLVTEKQRLSTWLWDTENGLKKSACFLLLKSPFSETNFNAGDKDAELLKASMFTCILSHTKHTVSVNKKRTECVGD